MKFPFGPFFASFGCFVGILMSVTTSLAAEEQWMRFAAFALVPFWLIAMALWVTLYRATYDSEGHSGG